MISSHPVLRINKKARDASATRLNLAAINEVDIYLLVKAMITHPDDGGHPDGLNWLTLDESGKNAYICGFIEGLFQGHCFTTWGLPGEQQGDPCYTNATRSFENHWDRFIANATYRQFLEGLNRFYAEEKNSKIEIQHGMWIVMNEIAGMPRTNLEEMIDAWRQKDDK